MDRTRGGLRVGRQHSHASSQHVQQRVAASLTQGRALVLSMEQFMPPRGCVQRVLCAPPYLVRDSANRDSPARVQHLHLVRSIASARHAHAAAVVPPDLRETYEQGLIELRLIAAETLVKADDEETLLAAAGSMVAAKGFGVLGWMLPDIRAELTCTACGAVVEHHGSDLFDDH